MAFVPAKFMTEEMINRYIVETGDFSKLSDEMFSEEINDGFESDTKYLDVVDDNRDYINTQTLRGRKL